MSGRPAVPISVCLIAKNERRRLKALHESLKPILTHPEDEVVLVDTGSCDNTPKRARELGWHVYLHPELSDQALLDLGREEFGAEFDADAKHPHFQGGVMRSFAEARALSFKYAMHDACFWLDLDDELVDMGELRPFIDKVWADGTPSAIFLRYAYGHDENDGECTVELWRERIVSRAYWEWKGRCHEVLVPTDNKVQRRHVRATDFLGYIRHLKSGQSRHSDVRNYLIQFDELRKGGTRDPRTVLYLANACKGLGRTEQAIDLYTELIETSGSRDDVFFAHMCIGHAYQDQGRHWLALDWAQRAQRVDPADRRAYMLQAKLWFDLEHWRNTLVCLRIADQFPPPQTSQGYDPTENDYQPGMLGAVASQRLGHPENAVEFAARAVEARPNSQAAQDMYEGMQAWARAEMGGMALKRTLAMAKPDRQRDILKLVHVSPHMMEEGIGEPETTVPGKKGQRTVAFYCGRSAEKWGPPSVELGIGASEKMVYEMARALAKRGLAVAVYATLNCDPGCYDGVHWRHSATFNPDLYRDYVVVWRAPQVVDKIPFRAGKLYVWMHDVGWDQVWTPAILALTDKVLFLSEFHRSRHPSVPDEKVFLTRNGIDLAAHLYDGRRKEKRAVFCSSPDRGWLSAAQVFRDSGLEQEGWKLNMFYGFGRTWRELSTGQEYGYIPDVGHETRVLQYEDKCRAACDGRVVIHRGRVGWREMAEEMKSAACWLYPTRFDEISCVAAMEAMAAGCFVVATESAALRETLAGYRGWKNLTPVPRVAWGSKLRDIWVPTKEQAAEWGEHARRFDIGTLEDERCTELFDGRTGAATEAA